MPTYVAPPAVVDSMIESGETKSRLSATQMVLRSAIAVFLLGGATTFAILVAEQTGVNLVGALVFPMGLTIVVLLGVELITGNFALVPIAVIEKRTTFGLMLKSFGWVLVGHLVGGLLVGVLVAAVASRLWTVESALSLGLIDTAVTKTLDYQELGALGGPTLAVLSGMLCNFLVVLGVIMGMTSTSTSGKILAIWTPIAAFYALGYEHSVVNFFVIPTGMMLGAPVGIEDWLLWNQIPVLAGNLIGGLLLIGLPLYYAHRTRNGSE